MNKLLEVKPLSQRDPQWSRILLGFSTQTIGNFGCVDTVVAMMCLYFGKITDPAVLNESMKSVGGFVGQTKNLFNWPAITSFYPDILYKGTLNYSNIPADVNFLKSQIDKRFPTPIRVEADEIGTPKGDHFLLVTGYDDNDLWVIDPWDENPHAFRLGERYSQNGSHRPEHIILGTRPFEFVGQFPQEKPRPVTDKAQATSEVFKGLTGNNIDEADLNKYKDKPLDQVIDEIIKYDKRFYDYRVKFLINERDDQWQKLLDDKMVKAKKACDQEKSDLKRYWQTNVETAKNKQVADFGSFQLIIKALSKIISGGNKNNA